MLPDIFIDLFMANIMNWPINWKSDNNEAWLICTVIMTENYYKMLKILYLSQMEIPIATDLSYGISKSEKSEFCTYWQSCFWIQQEKLHQMDNRDFFYLQYHLGWYWATVRTEIATFIIDHDLLVQQRTLRDVFSNWIVCSKSST